MTSSSEIVVFALAAPRNRRRAAQIFATVAGSLLIARAGFGHAQRDAIAQGDEDEDGSGQGRGRGRGRGGDNNGDGNAAEEELGQAEIPAGSIEVRIVGDDAGDFVPGDLTVDLGQSVTFVNAHSDEHTATGSGFDTGIIPSGGSATVTLDEPGRFAYACQIHPEMTGRVSVRDDSGIVPEQSAAAASAPADAILVRIANLSFDPSAVSIEMGQTVTWTNEDTVPHTVTSLDGIFDSGIFDPGASFSWRFGDPGTFPYQCQLHPTMQGSVAATGDPVAMATPGAAADASTTPAQAGLPVASDNATVWFVELIPEDTATIMPHRAVVTMRGDGSVVANFAPAQGAYIPIAVLTAGHGAWLATDEELTVTIATLAVDGGARFTGTVLIDGQAQMDTAGGRFEGTFSYRFSPADGGPPIDGRGVIQGELAELAP